MTQVLVLLDVREHDPSARILTPEIHDHRPVVQRQQVLVRDPRERMEPRSGASGENDAFHADDANRVTFPAVQARPRRSCLTVPASSVRMLEKATGLDADEIVVDLEDGVAANEKGAARANLSRAEARGTLALRINGVGTPWWQDDLAAVDSARFDVVVVPKVSSTDELAAVVEHLPAGVGLEAQIETARGLVEVERIAALGAPLEALVFGPGDFAAPIGVPVLTIGAGASDYALARS